MPEAVINPWTFANWNVTAQGRFVQQFGLEKAQAAAKEAGTVLGGARPVSHTKTIVKHFIFKKVIERTSGGGGGLVGAGSSGDGPPED